MVRAAENEILDTSGYLLNVKFINCLLCFSTKDERRRLKERARNGLMRGFGKISDFEIFMLVLRKFRKI